MAALWNVQILDKGPAWLTVEVRQAHPDAGEFPASRAFALRLLHEQAWELDASFHYRATSPLGQACDSKQVLDEDWVSANVDRFIAGITAQDTSTTTLDEAAAERLVADRLGLGDLGQLTDDEKRRLDDAYNQLWKDPSRLPARRYRFEVTDPAFLAHLAPGARWGSAAF